MGNIINVKIHNKFDVFKTRADTGMTEKVAHAENIILDNMWTLLGGSAWGAYLHVGSGTGTLAKTRTQLFNKLGHHGFVSSAYDMSLHAEGVFSRTAYITIDETTYVGQTITEVGVGTSASLATHALLQDMNGNPVSILKTSTDILKIYATIYAYIDPQTVYDKNLLLVHSFSNPDDTYLSTTGLYRWLLGNGTKEYALGGKKVAVSATLLACNTIQGKQSTPTMPGTEYSYSWSAVNKRLTVTAPRIGVSTANTTIRAILAGDQTDTYYVRIAFGIGLIGNPDWPGSFIQGASLGTGDGGTKDFVTAYGFIKPGAKVYLDGVEQVSGVTVDEALPIVNRLDYFIKPIDYSNAVLFPGITNSYVDLTLATNTEMYCIFENPYYADIGIDLMSLGYCILYCSDDMETWTLVVDLKSSANTSYDTSAYRSSRYWKVVKPGNASSYSTKLENFRSNDLSSPKNVHFDSAPALNSVITIDYTTDECVKNANYVLDISFALDLAEYVEEY